MAIVCCLLLPVVSISYGQEEGADEEPDDELSMITVIGRRVANEFPASTYDSVATLLRYDPQLDLQSRGLAGNSFATRRPMTVIIDISLSVSSSVSCSCPYETETIGNSKQQTVAMYVARLLIIFEANFSRRPKQVFCAERSILVRSRKY